MGAGFGCRGMCRGLVLLFLALLILALTSFEFFEIFFLLLSCVFGVSFIGFFWRAREFFGVEGFLIFFKGWGRCLGWMLKSNFLVFKCLCVRF